MYIEQTDQEIRSAIQKEKIRQQSWMELIASENYQSTAVLEAQASIFANKYAEWYPGKRYYGGQEFTDTIESLAIERAKKIFSSDHANVQALSGAAANICTYAALMQPGDSILGMDLSHGGHLTHGAPVTFMSKVFQFHRYKTVDGKIDFAQVRELAHTHKPTIILAGFSAYPRELDYEKFAEIAKEVGAIAYADISHIGGFVAAGLLKNPMNYGFHAMMTTTHKSLRWPRGSLILSKGIVSNPLKAVEPTIENIPTRIDRAVFPGVQGWPHMNTIAAIAVALHEAQTDAFKAYAQQTLKNAQVMAQTFQELGYKLVTWGTDNHMVVVDFSGTGLDGSIVEKALDHVGISVSKSTIPDDPNPPFKPSGIRVGIQAMTTRGIKENETKQIIQYIDQAIKNHDNIEKLQNIKTDVERFCLAYPIPSASYV